MPNLVTRTVGFLRRHPVLCLALLTPGIPEYLSGSSPFTALVLNPPWFVIQLVLNLGLYLPGVLLVREAMIRWRKGWATVLLLGAAYGILEEGVALSTLFNSHAQPVGKLGEYGHWVGVNWIWSAGIIPVHMIFSISLPILILGLALPSTSYERFLTGRKLLRAAVVLFADVTILFIIVLRAGHFWMGTTIFVSSLATICGLAYFARRISPDAVRARSEVPSGNPRRTFVIGLLFFPIVLLTEYIPEGMAIPAGVDFLLVIAVQALFLRWTLGAVGSRGNEKHLISLAFGLILPIAVFGVIAQIKLPIVLVADLVMVLFFRRIWRGYAGTPEGSSLPTGSNVL